MNAALRIFVVDDDQDAQILLRHSLRKTAPDFGLRSFSSGAEVLDRLKTERCDVLITNHTMREMDGFTLIREVRKEFPQMPIVIVSKTDPTGQSALEAGANAFVAMSQRRKLGRVIADLAFTTRSEPA